MTEPRALTAASIVAERADMTPTGEFYLELATTGAVVAAVTPHDRRAVASFLRAILARAPLAGGEAYEAHRVILGALQSELEAAAIVEALDMPESGPADLREPATAARERQLVRDTREWAAGERSRRGDAERARVDALLDDTAPHEAAQARLDAAVAEAEAFLAGEAAPEATDAAALFA